MLQIELIMFVNKLITCYSDRLIQLGIKFVKYCSFYYITMCFKIVPFHLINFSHLLTNEKFLASVVIVDTNCSVSHTNMEHPPQHS